MNKEHDMRTNCIVPPLMLDQRRKLPYLWVNKASFMQSDTLDSHIKVVEDLYPRYFERGNHKLATGNLRSLTKKHSDQSGNCFQNGFLVGTGLVFSVQGLVCGAQLLFHEDAAVRQQTRYLFQVYAGYFLMLLLFSLFCLDCMVWTTNRINYSFIFQFNQRRRLDWIRLAQFPSFFFLLFGVFIWTNFSRYCPEEMYLDFPVILIGVTAIVILLPFPVLAHRSRKWFAYSHVGRSRHREPTPLPHAS